MAESGRDQVGGHAAERDTSQKLVEQHQFLITSLRDALKTFPRSVALSLIFHSAARPFKGVKLKPDERAASTWRGCLERTMEELRRHVFANTQLPPSPFSKEWQDSERHFPLIGYGYAPNIVRGNWDSLMVIIPILERQRAKLEVSLEPLIHPAQRTITSAPEASEPPPSKPELTASEMPDIPASITPKQWLDQNWNKRLRAARANHGDGQKQAAVKCTVAAETYKKWEQGKRAPAQANMPKALGYMRSAPSVHD